MHSRSVITVFISILFYGLNCVNGVDEDSFGRLVVNTGDNGLPPDIMLQGGDERSMDVETRSTSYGSCLGGRMCVPMSDCSAMYYEVAKSCYNGDRSMYCGGTQYEPYICCPRSPLEHSSVCGKTLVSGQFYRGLGAFPFVARIGFKNLKQNTVAYPCTGSVILRRVILTAAHCALAKAEGYRLASVRLGEYDTNTDPDCSTSGFCAPTVINHMISHVVIHPDYKHGHYHHDIALVILKTPLNYTVATQPICLHPDRDNLIVGKRATVVGWGKKSHLQRQPIMQFLEVPLTAWDQCARIYGQTGALESPKSVDGQWMCAGGEGRDVCAGFGGAPLVIKENGVYLQIGIMSFGSDNCGGRNIPSVYTSIAHFIQWIRENSPNDSSQNINSGNPILLTV